MIAANIATTTLIILLIGLFLICISSSSFLLLMKYIIKRINDKITVKIVAIKLINAQELTS